MDNLSDRFYYIYIQNLIGIFFLINSKELTQKQRNSS